MTNPELGIIIQARLNSSRLPRKVFQKFYDNKNLLDLVLEKIDKLGMFHQAVVATSVNPLDDEIVDYCAKIGVNCFRGPEQNVLLRFVQASENFGFTHVIRICSDNPFLSVSALKELSNPISFNYDYVAYRINRNLPSIKSHLGFWPEFVSFQALHKILDSTIDPLFLEHVTNYLYSHPHHFNIHWIDIDINPPLLNSVRFTLDTQSDFEILNKIKEDLEQNNIVEYEEILTLISKNEQYLELMKENIRRNEK